jgi:hypothetical protein
MSVLSLKRVIQFVVATILAVPLLANHPSPRIQPRMAFDESTGTGVMFGGRALDDRATGLVHASDQTWLWLEHRNWQQIFPAHHPPARSSHMMTYDSKRGRVLLFGGRKEGVEPRTTFTELNDLWEWKNGDWSPIETATKPPVRQHAAIAYDRVRDKVILFGGFAIISRLLTPLYDTWEFDGTDWKQVGPSTGPTVDRPLMAYDIARNQTVLLGINKELKTLMHVWDTETSAWKAVPADPLPGCVNDGALEYQVHNERLITTGGICTVATTPSLEESWEWDGTKWTKLEHSRTSRVSGAASMYDTARQELVRYGGASSFGQFFESFTSTYRDLKWQDTIISSSPSPRSLAVMRRDPVRDTIWLFGGLSEFSSDSSVGWNDDMWRYAGGRWNQDKHADRPAGCASPMSAFDTDRGVLVIVCAGTEVNEWDGTQWKSFGGLDKRPDDRRFAAIAYDQNIKKTVLFGGFDEVNYRQDTWTWDGTVWTELKPSKKPQHRAQMTMWYDPLAKKTILFSGAGRPNIDERATRFNDMWAFDGTNWAQLTVTGTPGIRFGAQVAVDPRNGKVLLFGGLRATIDEEKDTISQFYGNDTWLWDGAASRWTQVTTENAPSPRQNVGLEFDNAGNRFVLVGGFAGNLYLSDVWVFDGQNWTPELNSPVVGRRRASRK